VNTSATSSDALGSGRKRVLFVLKTNGPQTAAHIAKRLVVTTMAVRQHLAVLEGEALVDFIYERRKVGRPVRLWRLTDKGNDRFPDRHAEFVIAMLQAVDDVFGENGFERLAEALTRQQTDTYRARMPPRRRHSRSGWPVWPAFAKRKVIPTAQGPDSWGIPKQSQT
jgi:predicted ArsR family transcriptional regulator